MYKMTKTGALCEVCLSQYDLYKLTTTEQHYMEINYIKPYPYWSRFMELKNTIYLHPYIKYDCH